MQNEDTLTAMEFAGLSSYETWLHYCNAGGCTAYFEFKAYLYCGLDLEPQDADLVSQAVNELIDDVCAPEELDICRAPYSWAVESGFDPGDLPGEDVPGEENPTCEIRTIGDELLTPRSTATFGSRFLSGLDGTPLPGCPGIPLPPGTTVELLGEIMDSGVIARISSDLN